VTPFILQVPPGQLLEPLQVEQEREVITGNWTVQYVDVIVFDSADCCLPLAVARAVIASLSVTCPELIERLHTPPDTVVVPNDTPFLNTLIVVPLASVLVPVIDVDTEFMPGFTYGAAEIGFAKVAPAVMLARFVGGNALINA
jgi:hypothetical protein